MQGISSLTSTQPLEKTSTSSIFDSIVPDEANCFYCTAKALLNYLNIENNIKTAKMNLRAHIDMQVASSSRQSNGVIRELELSDNGGDLVKLLLEKTECVDPHEVREKYFLRGYIDIKQETSTANLDEADCLLASSAYIRGLHLNGQGVGLIVLPHKVYFENCEKVFKESGTPKEFQSHIIGYYCKDGEVHYFDAQKSTINTNFADIINDPYLQYTSAKKFFFFPLTKLQQSIHHSKGTTLIDLASQKTQENTVGKKRALDPIPDGGRAPKKLQPTPTPTASSLDINERIMQLFQRGCMLIQKAKNFDASTQNITFEGKMWTPVQLRLSAASCARKCAFALGPLLQINSNGFTYRAKNFHKWAAYGYKCVADSMQNPNQRLSEHTTGKTWTRAELYLASAGHIVNLNAGVTPIFSYKRPAGLELAFVLHSCHNAMESTEEFILRGKKVNKEGILRLAQYSTKKAQRNTTQSFIEKIRQTLIDTSKPISARQAAARQLGEVGGQSAIEALTNIMQSKKAGERGDEYYLRVDATLALGSIMASSLNPELQNEVGRALTTILNDKREYFNLRGKAALALGKNLTLLSDTTLQTGVLNALHNLMKSTPSHQIPSFEQSGQPRDSDLRVPVAKALEMTKNVLRNTSKKEAINATLCAVIQDQGTPIEIQVQATKTLSILQF